MSKLLKQTPSKIKYLPEILAAAGMGIYLAQTIIYALHQLPNLDEGAYLFKGYQFATGNYQPFQPYGFWTNKMYLSFLIWGWIQELFSPGLLAPRLFASLFGVISLLGTWIVTRRLGGRWIAALAVAAMALNPTLISIYSLANSQVLVICLLTWVLVLTLGANRPAWQVILGGILSAILVFFRENMIFVVPLLLAYIFWQHGKKTGFLSLGAVFLILVVGHLIYWPEITYLWIRQIPLLSSIFDGNSTTSGNPISDPLANLTRIHSLATALRNYFVPLLCLLAVIVFWPRKKDWKSPGQLKASWFLLVTYLILLASHLWASVGNDYCVYCSTTYLAFFSNLGLILFAACYDALNRQPHWTQKLISIVTIPILVSAIWYSWFERIGIDLINLNIPRLKGGRILPGNIPLWDFLEYKFHLEYGISRQLIPACFGFMSGILMLALLYLIYRLSFKDKHRFALFYICSMIICGILCSPLTASKQNENYCTTNLPKMYQELGKQLDEVIPAGSKIYLDSRQGTILLLYLSDVTFYPPQINGKFSLKTDRNSDKLLKKGLWNEELANIWRKEADYFIIEADSLQYWQDLRKELNLVEVSIVSNSSSCPSSRQFYLFQPTGE